MKKIISLLLCLLMLAPALVACNNEKTDTANETTKETEPTKTETTAKKEEEKTPVK